MQGRTAQSAMLELARQLEEARAEIATLTTALDERDLEAERGLEQYDSLVRDRDRLREQVRTLNSNIETFEKETWRYKHERDEARAEVERLTREPAVHPSNLTDVVSLLEDERDELLVRVANQDAELRATREAYRDAYRRLCAPMWEEP